MSGSVLNLIFLSGTALECYFCSPFKAQGKLCESLDDAEVIKCKADENFCVKTIIDGGKWELKTCSFNAIQWLVEFFASHERLESLFFDKSNDFCAFQKRLDHVIKVQQSSLDVKLPDQQWAAIAMVTIATLPLCQKVSVLWQF